MQLYKDLAKNYENQNQLDSALYYLKAHLTLRNKLINQKQIEKVEELETKYQTTKKEKENLQLKQEKLLQQQKKEQNRNLFYATFIALILVGSIAYLNLKNSRKKRLLAEQQKELEKQKN